MTIPGVLPADVARKVEDFCTGLKQDSGPNLRGLIVYGGVARGRYRLGTSDINLMLLLGDASTPSLRAITDRLEEAWRAIRVDPFILTTGEFNAAAESFPTKFIEIRKYHVPLFGENPFPTLQIDSRRALIRIEQELRNLQLRLRRRYLAIHDSPELMYQSLGRIVVPLAVTLDAMLELSGKADPSATTRAQVLQKAAGAFNLDAEAMNGLAALRAGEAPALEAEMLFSRVLDSIACAAQCCVNHRQEAT